MRQDNNSFIDTTNLTKWAKWFLYLNVIIAVVSIASTCMEYQLFSDFKSGIYTSQELAVVDATYNDARENLINLIQFLILTISGILILKWIYVSSCNAHHSSTTKMKFTPVQSVAWFFISVLNLWKPYQVMKEIWETSDNPINSKKEYNLSLLRWWWFFWIAYGFFLILSFLFEMRSGSINELMRVDLINFIADCIFIALFFSMISIIDKIYKMQTLYYQCDDCVGGSYKSRECNKQDINIVTSIHPSTIFNRNQDDKVISLDDILTIEKENGYVKQLSIPVDEERVSYFEIESNTNYKELHCNIPIFLKSKNIDRFYHFTDVRNLESIIDNRGLYSWSRIQKNNITSIMSSDELSRELDTRKNLQDYVRLSFVKNHPMKYIVEKNKGLNLILLEIDVSVACWESTLFSDINATDNNVAVGDDLDFLKGLSYNIFQQKYMNLDDLEKKKYQAEILVEGFLPIKYIKNMDELKEKYLDFQEIPF